MKFIMITLIEDLIEQTRTNMNAAIKLQDLDTEILNRKSDTESWSALECIEHLNRYGDFYIPEINRRLNAATEEKIDEFKSGLIGNYFAKSMQPGQKPMKTLKTMNPAQSSQVRPDVLDVFIAQQKQLLIILQKAQNYNLTRIKTSISISNVLKLRLGDTLRVVIYHNSRHMAQANNAV